MHFSNCFEKSVTKYSLAFKYTTHKLKTNNELLKILIPQRLPAGERLI